MVGDMMITCKVDGHFTELGGHCESNNHVTRSNVDLSIHKFKGEHVMVNFQILTNHRMLLMSSMVILLLLVVLMGSKEVGNLHVPLAVSNHSTINLRYVVVVVK